MQRNATSLALQQRQRRAAAALASGHSVTRTARILGINPCTIYRWLHQPSFRQAIEAAIAERKRAERELIERMAERAADSLSRELSRRRSTVGKVALIRGVLDLALQMEAGQGATL